MKVDYINPGDTLSYSTDSFSFDSKTYMFFKSSQSGIVFDAFTDQKVEGGKVSGVLKKRKDIPMMTDHLTQKKDIFLEFSILICKMHSPGSSGMNVIDKILFESGKYTAVI